MNASISERNNTALAPSLCATNAPTAQANSIASRKFTLFNNCLIYDSKKESPGPTVFNIHKTLPKQKTLEILIHLKNKKRESLI